MKKELREIVLRNIALCAIERAIEKDLEVLTENWDSADEYFMEAFGCTVDEAEEVLNCKLDVRRHWA